MQKLPLLQYLHVIFFHKCKPSKSLFCTERNTLAYAIALIACFGYRNSTSILSGQTRQQNRHVKLPTTGDNRTNTAPDHTDPQVERFQYQGSGGEKDGRIAFQAGVALVIVTTTNTAECLSIA